MKFESRVVNLPKGDNLSFFVISENEVLVYQKNGLVKTRLLSLSQIARCKKLKQEYACDKVIRVDNNYLCLCKDTSMSIVGAKCEIIS